MEAKKQRQKFIVAQKECPFCKNHFTPNGADRSRQKFCTKLCAQKANAQKGKGVSGDRGKHLLKTGQLIDKDGYRKVLVGDHPFKRGHHYMRENVKVMEAHIGRRLKPNEVVHHINKEKLDNRIENLQLMSREDHQELHKTESRNA